MSTERSWWGLGLWVVVLGCNGNAGQTASAPPAESASSRAESTVTLSSEALESAGVKTERVARATIPVGDEMPGTLETPTDALVLVNSTAAGVVQKLTVDVGERVTKDQPLATLQSLDLAKAQAEYQRAAIASGLASSVFKRTEGLEREGLLSKRRLESDRAEMLEAGVALSEAAERIKILGGSLKDTKGEITISAPIAGTVTARRVNRGEAVPENSPLFTVVDVAHLIAQVRAPVGTHVEPGTEIRFSVEGLSEQRFTGKVASASDVVDPETRRFFVRATVDNASGALKPGMFISAEVPRTKLDALTVPKSAVLVMDGESAVFVARGGGAFEKRPVKLGAKSAERVAVEKGLSEGEEVVVEGAFWVRTELQKSELEE